MYLKIFILTLTISLIYLKIADKFNIIDKPNHRSSHTTPTIRGGGILFFLAILIYFILSGFQYPYFVIGVSLIAIVSFVDDIVTLSSNVRLPFQFIAIGLCLLQIGFTLNNFLILIPLLIAGVGFINIYNFMDGINGITGMYSIVVLLGMLFINLKENIVSIDLIIYSLISLVVFGFYNFRKKARMFAGDIGSISIAVLLFFIGSYLIKELKSPLILLFILVYGADAILTLGYRKSIGERITEPHRKHIYQKLVHTLKLPHLKVSLFYAITQAIINVIVYFGYQLSLRNQLIILFSCIVVFVLIYVYLFRVIEKRKVLTT
ncbi:UDP-N-acetylmuramyl pentapeptide phosphotransferase/UDP-N-acetylglucosamine-1-phosphate transferase [Tenacibaculum adriaticum]|uniref:UDP-N-acetylmuramyl pentapeptide phosphotransferase/UDP-N-acetylglucosamine-1-phosphate transferase n=1 Tax=Tenacibaculum adriaticum TaxID=413713 RepID=A0A5S5DN27_9FLAO|nr:UDP-N-acetylmuramyl pentapeptide phosphotransferase/UDP-N-acetylglucosamine-1-phosphate transferase [Tenacibaculum adriaticum]